MFASTLNLSFVVRVTSSQNLPYSRFLKLVLYDCSDEGSTGYKVCTCSGKRKYINANIHALSGILTHYVDVRAVKHRKCLTLFDHRGRRRVINIYAK